MVNSKSVVKLRKQYRETGFSSFASPSNLFTFSENFTLRVHTYRAPQTYLSLCTVEKEGLLSHKV